MGIIKKDKFNENQNNLASIFKALGHPARIAIIEYLLKTQTCVTNEIINEIPLAQSTILQHLKELQNAGLIIGNIEGVKIYFCLNNEKFFIIKQFIDEIINIKIEC
jgi:DNA-binding transcriptional ArsR family regulator